MDNFEIIAQRVCVHNTNSKFWNATNILLNNPHLINRRIAISSKVLFVELVCNTAEILEWFENTDFSFVLNFEDNNGTQRFMDLLNANKQWRDCECINDLENLDELQNNKTYLWIAKLLPRNQKIFSLTVEIALIDKHKHSITYFHKYIELNKQSLGIKFPYRLQYTTEANLCLSIDKTKVIVTNDLSLKWLKEQLFQKFVKWVENEKPNSSFSSGSLNLIPSESYVLKYNQLKKKYGIEMVKVWPESTDPAKFVYEDIAIATYLLLLWEQERNQTKTEKLQSFLDLGCGNGLLVHILASEGHLGLGIDLRKRKIWDHFPKTTQLQIRTIIPSSANLFPETDWLIGNHSDELTPWIPVIAARSSYNCRFFLLPCCAYEFNGSKYQRNNASCSQYFEYINYIKSISEGCGFKTEVDKLRIPSTKRICIIGISRNYSKELYAIQENRIQEIIQERSGKHLSLLEKNEVKCEEWSSDFKPRNIVEKVRNCTQVDKNLIADIINVVAWRLLSESRIKCIKQNGVEKGWNAGGTIELHELAQILAPEQLKRLKNECGGIQTLLKNNGHIFQIVKGKVQLKNHAELWKTFHGVQNKRRKISEKIRKMKPCWFYNNHPDGCPLSDEECNYQHEKNLT